MGRNTCVKYDLLMKTNEGLHITTPSLRSMFWETFLYRGVVVYFSMCFQDLGPVGRAQAVHGCWT